MKHSRKPTEQTTPDDLSISESRDRRVELLSTPEGIYGGERGGETIEAQRSRRTNYTRRHAGPPMSARRHNRSDEVSPGGAVTISDVRSGGRDVLEYLLSLTRTMCEVQRMVPNTKIVNYYNCVLT